MRVAVYLLFLQSFFLLYYSAGTFGSERYMLLIFGLLNFLLAWGIVKGERRAVKITIAYKGVDFFFAVLMLMAGAVFQSLNAAIDLAILHDLIGLFGKKEELTEET